MERAWNVTAANESEAGWFCGHPGEAARATAIDTEIRGARIIVAGKRREGIIPLTWNRHWIDRLWSIIILRRSKVQ